MSVIGDNHLSEVGNPNILHFWKHNESKFCCNTFRLPICQQWSHQDNSKTETSKWPLDVHSIWNACKTFSLLFHPFENVKPPPPFSWRNTKDGKSFHLQCRLVITEDYKLFSSQLFHLKIWEMLPLSSSFAKTLAWEVKQAKSEIVGSLANQYAIDVVAILCILFSCTNISLCSKPNCFFCLAKKMGKKQNCQTTNTIWRTVIWASEVWTTILSNPTNLTNTMTRTIIWTHNKSPVLQSWRRNHSQILEFLEHKSHDHRNGKEMHTQRHCPENQLCKRTCPKLWVSTWIKTQKHTNFIKKMWSRPQPDCKSHGLSKSKDKNIGVGNVHWYVTNHVDRNECHHKDEQLDSVPHSRLTAKNHHQHSPHLVAPLSHQINIANKSFISCCEKWWRGVSDLVQLNIEEVVLKHDNWIKNTKVKLSPTKQRNKGKIVAPEQQLEQTIRDFCDWHKSELTSTTKLTNASAAQQHILQSEVNNSDFPDLFCSQEWCLVLLDLWKDLQSRQSLKTQTFPEEQHSMFCKVNNFNRFKKKNTNDVIHLCTSSDRAGRVGTPTSV